MSTRLRCAVYTRKSTEEGLDQSFNSLDAQREACSAYILSQAGEGWSALKDVYDDGGFSGGTMERPALKRMMADIEARRIDIIVVYKVDRLTRSLADFARLVEVFDRCGVSFVSVTQAFNTTTSMGRLTLNVLLSFAQFEREVTGERIRDKIAASKAKGMWMGGCPPLGYDVRERALHINEAEAASVRLIFERYLKSRNLFALQDWLADHDVHTKRWISRSGRVHGGVAFSRGALAHILHNRVYLGEIVHRGKVYDGQHQAIIERPLFDAVQDKLDGRTPDRDDVETRGRRAPLLGKLFDDKGRPLTAAHANKKGVRYFYYVSTVDAAHAAKRTLRVSAPRLERCVVEAVTPLLAADWRADAEVARTVFESVRKVTIATKKITIHVVDERIEPESTSSAVRAGEGWRIVVANDLQKPASSRSILGVSDAAPRVDRALVRAVALSRRWVQRLAAGEVASIQALADQEGLCPVYTGQLLPLAYLAPDLVAQIVDGRQPPRLTLAALLDQHLPLNFAGQRALFKTFA